MSNYEERIINILKKEKIAFEREKTFNDLKHGTFRYDFYLPRVSGGCILEVDGLQHFIRVPIFQKTRHDFLKSQEHDRIKNSYCLANSIKLYRIPFWEIEKINCAADLFQDKFLVKTKWHNDKINVPMKYRG